MFMFISLFVYVLKSTSYNLLTEACLTGENIVERGLSPNVYIIVAVLLLTFDVIISRNFIYKMSVLHQIMYVFIKR